MLSGGLRDALLPLAEHLGVHRHDVYAVEIDYDETGVYRALRGTQPLTGQQGKPRVVHGMLPSLERPTVMIGDGATDAATRGVVDAFIAYTGVARRPGVVAVADAEAADFASLHPLLFGDLRERA
jgi:D-3-phosphoglycerate dehydrogenase